MSPFTRLLLGSVFVFPLAADVACSPSAPEAGGTLSSEVTSVENTSVKSQAIANCWLYATAGWVESLHKGATTRDVDVSEAYWNYWYWYEQITGGEITLGTDAQTGTAVEQGGWWGLAVEIIYRYGWMYQGDFLPDADAKAARHAYAVRALDDSLASGALKSPESRKDLKLVRQELSRAWKLGTSAAADIEAIFGGTKESITARAANGGLGITRIHAPQELPVLGADGTRTVTLADVVGTMAPGTTPRDGSRIGPEAWTETRYAWTADDDGHRRRKAMLKNLQHVLNRRLAIPFAWWVSSTAQAGQFVGARVTDSSIYGIHESILVDYEVDDVPGYGTLRVDERETRPAALAASLDDRARVKFFRIKNSWGAETGWTDEELRQSGLSQLADAGTKTKPEYLPSKPGFNDLWTDYVDRERAWGDTSDGHMLIKVALPPGLRFPIPAP